MIQDQRKKYSVEIKPFAGVNAMPPKGKPKGLDWIDPITKCQPDAAKEADCGLKSTDSFIPAA